MSDDKEMAFNLIAVLNTITKDVSYEIVSSGRKPTWETIYVIRKGFRTSLSEGFKTWKEVRVFLSGMRAFNNYGGGG